MTELFWLLYDQVGQVKLMIIKIKIFLENTFYFLLFWFLQNSLYEKN